MNTEKINKLIERENENREEQVADSARNIINKIGQEMDAIKDHNDNITELRKQLKELEHTPIQASTILG